MRQFYSYPCSASDFCLESILSRLYQCECFSRIREVLDVIRVERMSHVNMINGSRENPIEDYFDFAKRSSVLT